MRICHPPENVSADAPILRTETETAQHRRDAQVHAVALCEPEAILQLAVAREHRVVLVLRDRRITEPVLDVVHLRFHVEERLKRAARFLEHRAARVRQSILREIADGEIRRLDDAARVGLVEAPEHPEERRLARAVWAAGPTRSPVGDLH